MTNHFQNRSWLKEIDYTPKELEYLIDFAAHLKALKHAHIPHPYLQGKNIALLFEKLPPGRVLPSPSPVSTSGPIQNF